jgi:hypothetical protein
MAKRLLRAPGFTGFPSGFFTLLGCHPDGVGFAALQASPAAKFAVIGSGAGSNIHHAFRPLA